MMPPPLWVGSYWQVILEPLERIQTISFFAEFCIWLTVLERKFTFCNASVDLIKKSGERQLVVPLSQQHRDILKFLPFWWCALNREIKLMTRWGQVFSQKLDNSCEIMEKNKNSNISTQLIPCFGYQGHLIANTLQTSHNLNSSCATPVFEIVTATTRVAHWHISLFL